MTGAWRALTVLALTAVAVTACGDDDDDNGTGPDITGIAMAITIADLPAGEAVEVVVDGTVEFMVEESGTTELAMEDIEPGTYTVTLNIPAGCIGNPDEHVVTVDEGELEGITFTVACTPPA